MALPLLLSSGREVQTPRGGLGWLPEPTCGRALPKNFLGPALGHTSHVITHPGWDVGALFAQLGLAHMAEHQIPTLRKFFWKAALLEKIYLYSRCCGTCVHVCV